MPYRPCLYQIDEPLQIQRKYHPEKFPLLDFLYRCDVWIPAQECNTNPVGMEGVLGVTFDIAVDIAGIEFPIQPRIAIFEGAFIGVDQVLTVPNRFTTLALVGHRHVHIVAGGKVQNRFSTTKKKNQYQYSTINHHFNW